MLDNSALTKALFTKLEKATAAVSPKDLEEGREQNPYSAMHWTLENYGAGYKINAMRNGIIVSQKAIELADVTVRDEKGRAQIVPQEQIDALVAAIAKDVPASKKAT